MLGHKLGQLFKARFETWITLRGSFRPFEEYGLFDRERVIEGVDAFDFDTVIRAFAAVRPEVVINAIGVIKQLPSAKDPFVALTINSLFPHRLATLCRASGARLISIGTDCVFSGRRGMYTETDIADAEDVYGRTKYLGEASGEGCLTLRTSIIGRELGTAHSLIEWFLSNRGGKVKGFSKVIYSGFPTIVMAGIIADVIERQPDLAGLYHVSSQPINKYDLLRLVRDAYRIEVDIERDENFQIDRSLDSQRFRSATNFTPATWPEMVQQMADDTTPYDEWRRQSGS